MSLLLNTPYFYTATIKDWKHLLAPDSFKDIIIGSLKYLVDQQKLSVYGFVIMPNHLHLIWELLEENGKEVPNASFMKFTSHEFKKKLKAEQPQKLNKFFVGLQSRDYNFWQRDPLPIKVYSKWVFEQKLKYIHNNPLQEHWKLCKHPMDYKYSSASFYETGIDEFGFLTDYRDLYGSEL
ncbi:MAG: transposase [Chitinophagales bacterium]